MSPKVSIRPALITDAEQFQAVVAAVARERRYLMTTTGFPLGETRAFIKGILEGNGVQFYAVEGDRIVGWCDITRARFEGFKHVGTLGMGIVPEYRGQGLGKELMDKTLEAARDMGIIRVELEVFSSNTRAHSLYKSSGFVEEGIKHRYSIIGGKEDDAIQMALFLN